MTEEIVVKRGPGRPKKISKPDEVKSEQKLEPKSEPKRLRMKAKPNWENMNENFDDTPDRLRIPPGLIPEDLVAQWITVSVFGQPVPQHRSEFEQKGWTPVHQEDFDGVLDGMFMPRGHSGEITVDGLVLMVNRKEHVQKAKKRQNQLAREQIAIKEQSLRGGDIPVTLDARHPSAVNSNRISKSVERIEIPKD